MLKKQLELIDHKVDVIQNNLLIQDKTLMSKKRKLTQIERKQKEAETELRLKDLAKETVKKLKKMDFDDMKAK